MLCWSFILLFLFCEFGEQLTSEFNMFDEALCQSNWYSFPVYVQKLLLILMPNTQEPMLMQSYGNLVCARASFEKVNWFRLFFFSTILRNRKNLKLNFSFSSFLLVFVQTIHGGFSYFMTIRQMYK